MTMRIDHNLINWNAPLDDIRDNTEFDAALIADLNKAQYCVQMKTAFVTPNRIERMGDSLLSLPSRGVQLCIFLRTPDNWEIRHILPPVDTIKMRRTEEAIEILRNAGAHINLVKGIHQKVCVIDGCIVYRGSLNILSFYDSGEEMMRKVSPKESMQACVRNDLNQCICAVTPTLDLRADPDLIGAQLLRIRESIGLTQEQAVETLDKIDRTLLSRIERQEREPSFRQVAEICHRLGRGLHMLPPPIERYLLTIEHIMKDADSRTIKLV
ncbi:MAG: phospholipase D-like domain-containing protein [Candidatus Obscuribacterales bacterium]